MMQSLTSAIAEAAKLPDAEQDVLAAIMLGEISSERRWAQSFAQSGPVLESLASEALAEYRIGKTKPIEEL